VFVAMRTAETATNPQSISLAVYPIDRDVTRASFMDHMTDRMRQHPAVRDVTNVDEAQIPFLQGRALVRMLTCKYQGADATVLRMVFLRKVKRPDGQELLLGYLLGMGVLSEKEAELLPTLAAVAKSVAMTKFARPIDLLAAGGAPVRDERHGFTIRRPAGWAGRYTERGYEMGQMDFLRAGVITPQAEVIVMQIPDTYDSKSFGEQAIRLKIREGTTMEILAQRPAKLIGKEGFQFIVRKTPADANVPTIEVGRLICLPDRPGKKKLYAIVIRCYDCPAMEAATAMDKIASGFALAGAREVSSAQPRPAVRDE
jgi:hypothetical protein